MRDPNRQDVRRGEAALALGDTGDIAHWADINALLSGDPPPELARRAREANAKLASVPR
jgi:hypothetical protein